MHAGASTDSTDALIRRYFDGEERVVRLERGGELMRRHEPNSRLYLVREGLVSGTIEDEAGRLSEVMRAGAGDLVGVQSFFSGRHVAAQTVIALQPTTLAYVDRHTSIAPGEPSLERALMPLIVAELIRRQRAVLELADRERRTFDRIAQLERASALGRLAAGVAHELNNALVVLARGTAWVSQAVQKLIDEREKVHHRAFDAGLAHGRTTSAQEARRRAGELERAFHLPPGIARGLAAAGLSDSQLQSFGLLAERAEQVVELWELGATIHDMRLAADQAEHVVHSMRDLGGDRLDAPVPVDVNETIRAALKMLRSQLERVHVKADLADLPALRGSRGKLVQIWINLIRNACEAMASMKEASGDPSLTITTAADATHVTVLIEDTGPGIPPDILPRIFEPSFTTRPAGPDFGLGLGLAIVRGLVSEHGGDISASSPQTGGARFTVHLPREVLP